MSASHSPTCVPHQPVRTTLSPVMRQPATSAADVTLPRVTLSVVTRVTSVLVQLYLCTLESSCHVLHPGAAMCRHPMLPCVTFWSHHVSCTDVPRGLYRLYSHPFFFCLFDFSDRMRYLLHTDSVSQSKYTTGIRKTSWT
jgi:hypothetical protein